MYNLKYDQSIVTKEADKALQWLNQMKRITLWKQKNSFLVRKLTNKFQVTPLFFEEGETFLVIF